MRRTPDDKPKRKPDAASFNESRRPLVGAEDRSRRRRPRHTKTEILDGEAKAVARSSPETKNSRVTLPVDLQVELEKLPCCRPRFAPATESYLTGVGGAQRPLEQTQKYAQGLLATLGSQVDGDART